MAVVMAGEWVQNLARLEADLEEAVGAAVEAAQNRGGAEVKSAVDLDGTRSNRR